jgi:hypothetical protein
LKKKLQDHGVKKLIPDDDVLEKAFISAYKAAIIRKKVQEVVDQFDEKIQIPADLKARIEDAVIGTSLAWDSAINLVASGETTHHQMV